MKQYSREYKEEAVKLVMEKGLKIAKAARELGISHYTLKEWVEKHRTKVNAEQLKTGGLSPEERNRLLEKENAEIREERDILKKAIAIFSEKPKKNIGS